ncbi:MAG: hypothetical protein ACJA0U_002311 [Salibacteraceae bacterium]|jgi:hypothetical protein
MPIYSYINSGIDYQIAFPAEYLPELCPDLGKDVS